ncbi:MAG TPA: ferritin-like domain-containing protein [Acidobacteriaceae bacterium]|nr:ferritin-like domain-containing protein [Acidobacteriaceae bacterium]
MSQAKYTSPLCPGEKITADQLETDRGILAFQRAVDRLSRRRFLGGLSGATALAVSAGFISAPKLFAQAAPATPAISDVLNFALNLEYLEANLYSIVTSGNPVAASLQGSAPGAITGSPGKLTLDATTFALFQALASDEVNHINDLRSAITSLNATPISQPAINYAAKGAITTQAQLLATTRQFTALGNSAYAGAAQFLVSNPAVLTVAAQILGAEGQHLGAVNYQCITQNVTASFSTNSMAYIDEQDLPPSPTQYFTVALPGNAAGLPAGIPPFRTTSQDLGVVYGVSTPSTLNPPAGTTSGGFLPSGANGNIKST